MSLFSLLVLALIIYALYKLIGKSRKAEKMKDDIIGTTVETVKDAINDVIGDKNEGTDFNEKLSTDEYSTQNCVGCGAQVSGIVGQLVKCEFCDTEQRIK